MSSSTKTFTLGALALVLTASCTTDSPSPSPSGSTGTTSAEKDALTLDYTAYVDDAVQVSGLGARADGGQVALVTDFEMALIVDPASVQVINRFSVQFGELPEQGSSEAIAYRPDGSLAVFYPERSVIRFFAPEGNGEPEGQLELEELDYRGALVVLEQDFGLVAFERGNNVVLRAIDLDDGEIEGETQLETPIENIEGMGQDANGVYAVTRSGTVYTIDWLKGAVERIGTVTEVEEPSAIEPILNGSEEPVFMVADDADRYNSEPGPIRLYLR